MARSLVDPPEEFHNEDLPEDVTLKQVADMVYALFLAFKDLEAAIMPLVQEKQEQASKGIVNGL